MKIILVPTDFSDPAKNALKYAIEIAIKANARIKILHIYNVPVIPGITPFFPDPSEVQELIKIAEQQLKKLPLEMPELNEIVYETITVPGYGPIEIPEIIQNQKADMIIMGTKGASGLKKVILGSNTAKVIRGAAYPVLAVPEQARYRGIRNIGFAYDHETITEKLEALNVFTKLFNANIQIFHIKEKAESVESEYSFSEASHNHFKALNFNYTSIYNNDIEEGINKYIETNNIDILAMIPRRHMLFYRLFKSSLTKKMAFHSKIPLLSIPE